MSKHKKRIYNSESRQAKATLTRRRILETAHNLFISKGFEGLTIEKLAEKAGVSSPTIYGLFQSKRGVLRALMDEALPPEQFTSLVEEARAEKCPEKHLRISAKIARQIYDAERAQMDLFRSAAVLAPEFKELENERERRRYERQEDSIKMMQKSLANGVSVAKARDILWAFTGRDMYRMYVVERGWSSDAYEEWLGQLLINTLLQNF